MISEDREGEDAMLPTDTTTKDYQKQGYFVLRDVFTPNEIDLLRAEADNELRANNERVVREPDGETVRATHGSHQYSPFFGNLVRLPRLLSVVEQLLDGPVYVHQFKINAKAALGGEQWEWHQDYYFWHVEDAMPEPRAVNMVIHVDEANDLNGPLLVIPGSHKLAEIGTTTRSANEVAEEDVSGEESDWRRTVSASLKHTLDKEALRKAMTELGVHAITAPAGSVLVFHPSLLHGSAGNMSPFDRRLVIISYNSTSNTLSHVKRPRPEFLASRDFSAVIPLAEDALQK